MIELYTDGASRGNPGLSGAGVYIKKGNQQYEYVFPLGETTNHEAEFLAVIKGLDVCKQSFPGQIISVRSDSRTVIDVIEKNFTKNDKFLPFLETIREYIKIFPYIFFKWIPEKQNNHADKLAKKAIQMN